MFQEYFSKNNHKSDNKASKCGSCYLVYTPTKSPFSNLDLMWTHGVKHKGINKTSIEITYIAYACV
jgi:hypothetical protein